jgi:hypothetical protein
LFEEFIAQGNDMIRRQEKQIGMTAYSEAEIPAHERVTLIEAKAWREALELRIQTNFSPDAYARYRIFWDIYASEIEKKEGDVSSRYVNLWRRIVSYLVELDARPVARGQEDSQSNVETRKAG